MACESYYYGFTEESLDIAESHMNFVKSHTRDITEEFLIRESVLQNAYVQEGDLSKTLTEMSRIIEDLLNGIRTLNDTERQNRRLLGCLRCGGTWSRGVGTLEYPRTFASYTHSYDMCTYFCPYCGVRTIQQKANCRITPEEFELTKDSSENSNRDKRGRAFSFWSRSRDKSTES